MEYRLIERPEHLELLLRADAHEQEALLGAYLHHCHDTDCRHAHCGHPTDEYRKLARIGIDPVADGVRLRLETPAGSRISREQVGHCMRFLALWARLDH